MLSFKENIPIILDVVRKNNPKKIIDIGAGMGKYGILIREQYLSSKAEAGEFSPVDDIIIDAVEDTRYFLDMKFGILHCVYNKIYEKSVFDCTDIFGREKYDLALLIDIVEHWTKKNAIALMKEIAKYSNILVSTPKRPAMYKKHYYGDSRHHITRWNEDDFKEFKFNTSSTNYSHIIYIHHF